jgi:group I intron endonuclease
MKGDQKETFQIALLDEGFSNFTWEQIDTAETQEELGRKEIYWIAHYDSTNPDKGYNLKDGGINGKPSEETRRKQSEAHIGQIPWNKGKEGLTHRPPSEETRRRISAALIGDKNPMYGKHPTEETRKKLREAHSGENHPFFGKHHTEETRRKLSEAKKGRPSPRKGGYSLRRNPAQDKRNKAKKQGGRQCHIACPVRRR